MAWNCLFTPTFRGFWGHIFPKWQHLSDHCNPQKALPCAETRRLSHKSWKSVQRFDLGAGSRKQRKGQDRTVKKVTKALYFTYLGRSPHWTSFTKICTVVAVPDVITCANFWAEIFGGYDFTGGRISHFPIDSFMALQQYSTTALPVCDLGVRLSTGLGGHVCYYWPPSSDMNWL